MAESDGAAGLQGHAEGGGVSGRLGLRWLAALAALLVLGGTAGFVWNDRQQRLGAAADVGARRVTKLADELQGTLGVAQTALARLETRLQGRAPGVPIDDALRQSLHDVAPLLAALPLGLSVHAVGTDGRLLDGKALPAGLQDAALALPDGTRWRAGPVVGAEPHRVVPLLRRASAAVDGVAGWLVAFDHATLVSQFDDTRVQQGGGVALFRIEPDASIVLVARAPHSDAELGRRVRGPLAMALTKAPRGSFVALTQIDQTERSVAYQRLDGDAAELALGYGVATATVLAPWRALWPWAFGFAALVVGALGLGARRLDHALQVQEDQQRALQRSEGHLRALADNMPDVVVRMDRDGRHLYANQAVQRATGLPPQDFIGKTNAELGMPADNVALWLAALRKVFQTGSSERLEFAFVGPQGQRHWESLIASEPATDGGTPTALVISRDITERKQAEATREALSRRIADVLETMSDGFVSLDRDWRYQAINRRAGQMLGRDAASLLGKHIWTEFPEGVGQPFHRAYERAMDEGVATVMEEYDPPRDRWFENRIHPSADGISIFFTDITERVHSAKALRDSEERLRLALQAANQGLYDLDLRTGDAVVSPEYARMLGWEPDEFPETHAAWRERMHPDDRDSVYQVYEDYVAGRRTDYRVEFRQRLKDGGWKWILSVGQVLERDDQGRPLRMLGTHTDITATKLAQLALADSEARYRELFENNPAPMLVFERGGLQLLAVNEAFVALSGYRREESHALKVTDFQPVADREAALAAASRVAGFSSSGEWRLQRRDGSVLVVDVRSHDIAYEGRHARIAVITDLTERRHAEAERRAAAERFEKLFLAAPEAISLSELDTGRFLQVNAAFGELFGHEVEAVIGRTSAELNLWSSGERRESLVQRLRGGESVHGFEGSARHRSGERIDVMFSAERVAFDGHDCLLLMFRDITQRKRAEDALRRSEQRFRLASATGQVWEWDFAAGGVSPPDEFFNTLGLPPAEPSQIAGSFEATIDPDDLRELKQVLRRHLKHEGPYRVQFRAVDVHGRTRWFESQGQALWGDDGRASYMAGTTFEITERRQAEDQVRRLAAELEQRVIERTEQLARSEARYRTIFETVPVSIGEEDWSEVQQLLRGLRDQGVTDGPGYFAATPEFVRQCLRAVKVVRFNRQALLLHEAQGQPAGVTGLDGFYPGAEHLPQFAGELEALWQGQHLFTAKRLLPSLRGRPMSLMLTMSLPALDADDGTALVCLVDITEIDRLNAELDLNLAHLRHVNQELETFTYSVSHDLKAPLRGIDGYSRLLLSDHRDQLDAEGREFLGHIREATRHMADLIDDLLSYSRLERRGLTMARQSVAELVGGVLSSLRQEIAAAGAHLELHIDPALQVHTDVQGFAMALRNLIDNALKFSRPNTPPRISIDAERCAEGVNVAVRDDGVGFDMKFHDRIFSIFQRLHRAEDYPGTGIGLAIVKKAMERMGGRVWARSQPGQGATFTLQLPEAEAR